MKKKCSIVLQMKLLINYQNDFYDKNNNFYINNWIVFIFKIITVQRQIESTVQEDF